MPSLKALEALAERGATEGERKAARLALEKHRAKQAAKSQASAAPHAASSDPFASYRKRHFSQQAPTHSDRVDAYAELFRNIYQERRRCAEPWTIKVDFGHVYYRNADIVDDEDARAHAVVPDAPKWPDAVDVQDYPARSACVRFEVATRSEMFARFRENKPITIRWREHVYRTEGFSGTCEDRDVYPPRFYLTINTARLTRLD